MNPQHLTGNVRECDSTDTDVIYRVINEAAKAYKPVLPPGVYHEPQMSMDELLGELERVKFLAYTEQGRVLGVMGYEFVGEVALIRHAYVLPKAQRKGIGALLLTLAEDAIAKSGWVRRIVIGTYAAASWAISFYEKHGYRKSPDPQTVLRNYYRIPEIQSLNSLTLWKDL
jgi:GNAT superfamily N-acetyltransferase